MKCQRFQKACYSVPDGPMLLNLGILTKSWCDLSCDEFHSIWSSLINLLEFRNGQYVGSVPPDRLAIYVVNKECVACNRDEIWSWLWKSLHGLGDERWPTEVTSNTYLRKAGWRWQNPPTAEANFYPIGHYQNEWEPGSGSATQRHLGSFGETGQDKQKLQAKMSLTTIVAVCAARYTAILLPRHFCLLDWLLIESCPSKRSQAQLR